MFGNEKVGASKTKIALPGREPAVENAIGREFLQGKETFRSPEF
jgi:hypothetical protein